MRSGLATVLILMLAVTVARADETKLEACKLLTLQDVTSVVGGGFKPTELLKSSEICGYIKSSADTVGFFIAGPSSDAAAGLKDRQERFKKAGQAITPVAGLGEGAFYVIFNNQLTLNFFVGQLYAQLGVLTGGKPNVDATLKLAKIALARMP